MNRTQLSKEISFKTARSGGPGGQHANKVSTKVILFFNVRDSMALNVKEKALLLDKMANRINSEGSLIISCDSSRSQVKNKKIAVERFFLLLEAGLKRQKRRISTRASKAIREKRARQKKMHSEKKSQRRKKNFD